MPLSEYAAPEITDQYLDQLSNEQLLDLLMHKTNGLLVASRLNLANTDSGKQIQEEIQKLQKAIKDRNALKWTG